MSRILQNWKSHLPGPLQLRRTNLSKIIYVEGYRPIELVKTTYTAMSLFLKASFATEHWYFPWLYSIFWKSTLQFGSKYFTENIWWSSSLYLLYVLGIPAGVVAAPGVGNRPVVPGQGKNVKVIVAQDYIPDSFHFIVGVPS